MLPRQNRRHGLPWSAAGAQSAPGADKRVENLRNENANLKKALEKARADKAAKAHPTPKAVPKKKSKSKGTGKGKAFEDFPDWCNWTNSKGKGICRLFQTGECPRAASVCRFSHECVGCGDTGHGLQACKKRKWE